ncbi:hypothetical protein JavanS543_0016 [Streptococcus satellite phage Javan543]|uniref:Uncharacterized protein n=1 Tax=Streptococcus sanguinis SK1056 TaxID=888820 RepID=F3UDN9_STRSA|nr:hypothetical protein HMPREF9393_1646 [Streptococcus sanguinis SK1056]QBX11150.1 hypothetical protein JavanS543_0016 [Streptococcus satellite phage Javan543]QBX11191.1 hypothetical protein JavanS546_0003 [Streptococcus satellite phage Javan546]
MSNIAINYITVFTLFLDKIFKEWSNQKRHLLGDAFRSQGP